MLRRCLAYSSPSPVTTGTPPQMPTFTGSMLNFLRPMHSSFSFWANRL